MNCGAAATVATSQLQCGNPAFAEPTLLLLRWAFTTNRVIKEHKDQKNTRKCGKIATHPPLPLQSNAPPSYAAVVSSRALRTHPQNCSLPPTLRIDTNGQRRPVTQQTTHWTPVVRQGAEPAFRDPSRNTNKCTQAPTPIQTAVTEALEQTNRAFEVLTSYCSLNSVIFHEVGKALYEDSSEYWRWLAHHATHPPGFVKVMTEDIPEQRLLVYKYYAQIGDITLQQVCEAGVRAGVLQCPLQCPLPVLTLRWPLG